MSYRLGDLGTIFLHRNWQLIASREVHHEHSDQKLWQSQGNIHFVVQPKMLQPELNEFPLRVTSVSRLFIKIIISGDDGVFSMRMRFVFLSTHKQPLENQPLPGSFSQLVQSGR